MKELASFKTMKLQIDLRPSVGFSGFAGAFLRKAS